jgi:hypothetical protein
MVLVILWWICTCSRHAPFQVQKLLCPTKQHDQNARTQTNKCQQALTWCAAALMPSATMVPNLLLLLPSSLGVSRDVDRMPFGRGGRA